MGLLVFEIKQKYEDIKYTMKETWINLISLEKSLGELQCNKIPLICYGDRDSKSQITFSNLDSYDLPFLHQISNFSLVNTDFNAYILFLKFLSLLKYGSFPGQ